MKKIKVIIADGNTLVRKGVCKLLSDSNQVDIIGEADNYQTTIKLCKQLLPEVVILEETVISNVDSIREIKNGISKNTKIILIKIHKNNINNINRKIHSEIDAYINLNISSQELVNLIVKVKEMNSSSLVLRKIEKQNKENNYFLSRREIDVLNLLARGMSNKEISDELYVCEKTVKNHIRNIFIKMQTSCRTETVIKALKKDLVNVNKEIYNSGKAS
jgi:two-component system, NarL family, response regulator DegU